jgi:Alpha-L-arabinofuranosidase B (ABFB) domain/Ricin-type beta-trefoil lectin domain-like
MLIHHERVRTVFRSLAFGSLGLLTVLLIGCGTSKQEGLDPQITPSALSSCALVTFDQNTYYRILGRQSGKALEVAGIQQQNGAGVIQFDYLGQDNQKWKLSLTSDGFYSLTVKHSGKALDVSGISQNNGALLHQWDYVGGDNQKWCIIPTDSGYYRLVAKHSGKAADVSDYRLDNGAPIRQWDYLAQVNQQWKLEVVGGVVTPPLPPPPVNVLKVGSAYALRVATPGFTNRYLRHNGSLGVTEIVSATSPDALKLDASWKALAGLLDSSCFSFESVNASGQYLRQAQGWLRIDANDNSAGFKSDATFCEKPGLDGANGTILLESKSNPGRCIRHRNAEVWLDPNDNSPLFKQDASWTPAAPWPVPDAPFQA